MKILLINHYAGSSKFGMEYRPYYLAQEWIKAGHDVTFLAANNSHLRGYNPDLQDHLKFEEHNGVNFIWVKTPKYNGNGISRVINILSFAFNSFKQRKLIMNKVKPDVVITSSTHPMDIYIGNIISKKMNISLLYEVHDLWPLTPMKLGKMSKWNPFIMLLQYAENKSYRCADQVISMLPCAKEHMLEHGMAGHKFNYIPNGVALGEWENEEVVLSKIHQETFRKLKEEKRIIFGYAGGFAVSQDLDSLLQSASLTKNTNIYYVLVGDGVLKEEYAKKYSSKRVIFLPSVAKADIPAVLKNFDVAYLGFQKSPLYNFGVNPNKLFDYLMAGKPIVQGLEAGNNPVNEIGCGIAIAPESPIEISDAIDKLAELSQNEREKIGELGKEYALKHYTYEVLARKFLSIMKSAVEERK